MLVAGSFSEGLGTLGTFTLAKYIDAYTDPALAEILWNTVGLHAGSAAFATLLALFRPMSTRGPTSPSSSSSGSSPSTP